MKRLQWMFRGVSAQGDRHGPILSGAYDLSVRHDQSRMQTDRQRAIGGTGVLRQRAVLRSAAGRTIRSADTI